MYDIVTYYQPWIMKKHDMMQKLFEVCFITHCTFWSTKELCCMTTQNISGKSVKSLPIPLNVLFPFPVHTSLCLTTTPYGALFLSPRVTSWVRARPPLPLFSIQLGPNQSFVQLSYAVVVDLESFRRLHVLLERNAQRTRYSMPPSWMVEVLPLQLNLF